ncbi:LacI family DNA-binding transcriptional regulator [Streptomyces cellulosae]|uniref:LacI family DNA-binding transcriptional regulator n=1 Tax=Streptomyces cellulosae TaxID=1968 RepID=UPI00387E388A
MRNDPRVSARRREAVLKAAAELGYRPNAHAAQLASRRTMTVGVVLAELRNPVYTEIFTGVQEQAEQAGYGVLLTGGELLTTDTERRAIDGLLEHRVDGIVLVGPRLTATDLRELAGRVPLVVVGRHVQGVDSVPQCRTPGCSPRYAGRPGSGGTGAGATRPWSGSGHQGDRRPDDVRLGTLGKPLVVADVAARAQSPTRTAPRPGAGAA